MTSLPVTGYARPAALHRTLAEQLLQSLAGRAVTVCDEVRNVSPARAGAYRPGTMTAAQSDRQSSCST